MPDPQREESHGFSRVEDVNENHLDDIQTVAERAARRALEDTLPRR